MLSFICIYIDIKYIYIYTYTYVCICIFTYIYLNEYKAEFKHWQIDFNKIMVNIIFYLMYLAIWWFPYM